MSHQTTAAPQTAGSVLHSARLYDFADRLFKRGRSVREKLVELAAPASGEHVLDVGCGPGRLALALKLRVGAGDAHGIDASPEMIQVAKEKAAKSALDVDFRVGAIEALPFPDSSFDLVTSSLMLHHLPEHVKGEGLAEIRRVLKPGGRFVVADFARESHSPLGHLLAVLGHSRGERTAEKLTALLQTAGFDEIQAIATDEQNFAFLRAECAP